MREIKVEKNDSEQRLDRFLMKYLPKAPSHLLQKYIRKKRIKVNKKRAQADQILKEGDQIYFYIYEEELTKYEVNRKREIKNIQLDVVFENEDICIMNKPVDKLSHPASKEDYGKTMVDDFISYLILKKEYFPRMEKTFVPALANRLDRNTSGLIVGCKNKEALSYYNDLFKDRKVKKYYRSICKGKMKDQKIQLSLTKDEEKNKVLIHKEGKKALTLVKVLESNPDFSYIEIELITGRTHQIRAHLSEIGHPLIGDQKYGDPKINALFKKEELFHQLLHSYALEMEMGPLKGQLIKGKLPDQFKRIHDKLFGEEND